MFSSSVAGGTVCLGCQFRSVTRRAAPILAAAAHAQTIHTTCTARRRQNGSEDTWEGGAEDQLVAALSNQAHRESPRERPRERHASRKTPPKGNWDLPPLGKHRKDTFETPNAKDEFAEILSQQAHSESSRSRHARKRTKPQDDRYLPSSGERHRRQTTESAAQTKDDTAASVKQQMHQEVMGSHHADEKAVPEDDSKPPAESREDTERETDHSTPQDDLALVDGQEARKPAHSRWGIPPPEALGDISNESGAQEKIPASRKMLVRRVSAPNPYEDTRMRPMEELESVPEVVELKSWRKGRVKMVEDMARLPVETLGKTAEVIVLREDGEWIMRSFKEDKRPADAGLSLDEHVDQDEGISLDEIMDNIDELRPEHTVLPSNEFKNVFDLLAVGFTSYQLEHYVERHFSRLEEGGETPFPGLKAGVSKPLPWIKEQSVWAPEVEDALQGVDHPLKGYVLNSMRPKQRLVMQLMRECWGISAQELMDGQGVLEIQIRDMEFKLLTLGSQRCLQTISRVHLSHGAGNSIQVVKSRKTIRILAPKVFAEACLSSMNEWVRKKKTRAFKADSVPISHLDADTLEEMGRITNSVVRLNKVRKEVEVTWVDIRKESESKLEDVADVVFRLLLTAYSSPRTDAALTVYPEVEGRGKLVEDISNSDKLSWMDRRIRWARLCLPMDTQPPPVETSWPIDQASATKYEIQATEEDLKSPKPTIEPTKTARQPLSIPKSPRVPEQEEQERARYTPSGWLPFRVTSNAVFGHVLNVNDAVLANSINEGAKPLSTYSRTMVPLIPSIKEMDLPGWVPYNSPNYMKSVVLMRFKPLSTDPTKPEDPLAPHLELRLKATDERIIGLDSLCAVAHTHVSDVLLPAERVDVRITQKVVAEVPGMKVETVDGLQPLLQFLRDAKLEMAKGQLVTPPRLHGIGLPRWMFYRPEADPASPFVLKTLQPKVNKNPASAERSDDMSIDDEAAVAEAAVAEEAVADTAAVDTADVNAADVNAADVNAADVGATADNVPGPYDSDQTLPPYTEQCSTPAYNELRLASYVFAGLEVHRPLETTYDGWRLKYTSVEAGQAGGRRAELALEAVPGADEELRRAAADVDNQRFIRSVYRLARGADANLVVRPSDGTEVRARIGWVGQAPNSQ